MHLNLVVSRLVVVCALVACALAFPSPTTPVGDTVWNVGDDVEIRWMESGADPTSDTLSGIDIFFMTGPNIGQIKLAPIAKNLDKNATSAKWTVPPLTTFGYPAGNIYFLEFTDSKNPDFGISWSTRFRVLDGTKEVDYNPKDPWTIEPNNSTDDPTDTDDTDNTDNTDNTDDTDDTDNTDDTDSTNSDDGRNKKNVPTTTIITVPPSTPSSDIGAQDDLGNTAPHPIPTGYVSTFVTIVIIAAAAFFA